MSDHRTHGAKDIIQAILEVSGTPNDQIRKVLEIVEAEALQRLYLFYLDKNDELLAQIDIDLDGKEESDSPFVESKSLAEIISDHKAHICAIWDRPDFQRAEIGIIIRPEAAKNISFLKSLGKTVGPLLFSKQKWQWALQAADLNVESSSANWDEVKVRIIRLPRGTS